MDHCDYLAKTSLLPGALALGAMEISRVHFAEYYPDAEEREYKKRRFERAMIVYERHWEQFEDDLLAPAAPGERNTDIYIYRALYEYFSALEDEYLMEGVMLYDIVANAKRYRRKAQQ